jgi:glucose-6-phosphate isomerase
MGGSSLGANAIYDFLKKKIKKNFLFFDNLQNNTKVKNKKKYTNLIISKSGNTIETVVNANILIKKKDQNIFITEKKNSFLHILANKLKAEIIHHNNYIGGRYSVLSEVGMVPSELMGLNSSKFKQLNNLIKNKKFMNNLVSNVESILYFSKKKNSIQ